MALYRWEVKSGSRGAEQSAAAHADYIAREGKYSAGLDPVLFSESGNLPAFAAGSARAFWSAVDVGERANGRLWTEVLMSLPRELSVHDQVQLARDFAAEILGDRHAFTLAVHGPEAEDGQPNVHCHLAFSERVVDERTSALDAAAFFKRGGAAKDRSWNDRECVERLREAWEVACNKALAAAGSAARVDRRSIEERLEEAVNRGDESRASELAGRVPEPKIGWGAGAAARRAAVVAVREATAAIEAIEREIEAMKAALAEVSAEIRRFGRGLLGAFGPVPAYAGRAYVDDDARDREQERLDRLAKERVEPDDDPAPPPKPRRGPGM